MGIGFDPPRYLERGDLVNIEIDGIGVLSNPSREPATRYGAHMGRMNDVGGMEGFGPVDPVDDPEPFHVDWEARVYALNNALLHAGVYNLDEFRDAIERMPPAAYLKASYYERWFSAVRTLLAEKGVVDAADLQPPA